MAQFTIHDGREFYRVNEQGQILRQGRNVGQPDTEWTAGSDEWKVIALVRHDNFGHRRDTIYFAQWEKYLPHKADQLYKNGKSMWQLIDYDHGSNRMWGARVTVTRVDS